MFYIVGACSINLPAVMRGMKKDTSVNVRLESELREHLEELAKRDGRTLSNYIHRLLRAHVDKHPLPDKEPDKKKR